MKKIKLKKKLWVPAIIIILLFFIIIILSSDKFGVLGYSII